jgi:phage terminase large subunit-like protein
VALRYSREWKPPKSGSIDFGLVEAEIRRVCDEFNVVELTFDPYQLHDMASRLQRDGVVLTRAFNQGGDRLEADKQLFDLIVQRRYYHDGDQAVRQHVDNADKKVDVETRKLRLVKREESLKIDLAVSASMGAYRCLKLPLA